MSDNTAIEWADATWNPVTGCTEVSPGCDRCYAKTFAERWRGTPGHYFERGFDVQGRPDKLDQPLRWRRPRRIFVNSMSDLFHEQVPDGYIERVWAIMARSPQHTFQVLTKRHGRMRSLLSSKRFVRNVEDLTPSELIGPWPLSNVWLGVSTENQQWANIRIPALLDTPAAVRFISAEPLLGPIYLTGDLVTAGWVESIDWCIVGGESGHGARPMHPAWARSLRDQCQTAGIPFLFKQWGEWGPAVWKPERLPDETDDQYKARAEAIGATHAHTGNPLDNDTHHIYKPNHRPWSCERGQLAANSYHAGIRRWGKKAAGRELDGRTWDQYPEAVHA